MLSTVQLNHSNHAQDMVPENSFNKINNFRNDEHGPYSNPQQEDYTSYDANFEIANRAFYATINKFTRQACPDTSTRRRSPPYSFLENWHLHSIYSKSQQTLLGITPVKPSVLLSGDDFMFTPPFIQEEDEEEEEFYSDEDEEDDNQGNWDFYHLSPCPESNQAGELFSCSSYPPSSTVSATTTSLSYFETTPLSPHTIATTTKQYFYDQHENQDGNIWIENDERRPLNLNGFQSLSNLNLLTIQIPPQNKTLDPLSSPEEESSSSSSASSSSSDEQLLNNYSPSDSDSTCSSITSEKLDAFFNTTDDFENDADIDGVDDRNQLSPQQQELSSYDLMNLYDTVFPTNDELNRQQDVAQISTMISPVTRSSSFKSQHSIDSVVSYQSLADLMHPQQPSTGSSFYGSISHSFTFDGNVESSSRKSILNSIVDTLVNNNNNAKDHDAFNNEEMGIRPATNEHGTALNTIWTSLAIFIMYYWQLLTQFFTRESSTSPSNESESLL
ncbi:uncharacterized protein ATC70_004816 [Mucor velutinosus]|uniref:Uncharacterized protein n=1 Tax=Mucor velutinosus TaxID=708070 RepID=A0AAN7D9G6_9FUNG|nr:hypothetical protein ATC70_004816 [Mucor velutinosus]